LYAGYAAVLGLAINLLITSFYFHPRPFMDNIGTLLIDHVPETSFPSDHTTFMLSLSITLLLLKETRKTGMLLCILGLVGGFSRVLCGIHYPFDILGSLLVATAAGLIIFFLQTKLIRLNQSLIAIYAGIVNAVT
jgi:undecaprenyl-diphosphatase